MMNDQFKTIYPTLLAQLHASLALQIGSADEPVMVGIHTGGYWLAQRLHADLGLQKPLFAVSTTLQRDDFASHGLHKQILPTRLPHKLDDVHVILVDDILHTGRSIRAALNELFEFGRPASVRLAVLADRGGRELPIAADFVGAHIACAAGYELVLQKNEAMQFDLQLNLKNKGV